MNRCGTEYTHTLAFAFLELESLGLDDDAKTLYEEDATEER